MTGGVNGISEEDIFFPETVLRDGLCGGDGFRGGIRIGVSFVSETFDGSRTDLLLTGVSVFRGPSVGVEGGRGATENETFLEGVDDEVEEVRRRTGGATRRGADTNWRLFSSNLFSSSITLSTILIHLSSYSVREVRFDVYPVVP